MFAPFKFGEQLRARICGEAADAPDLGGPWARPACGGNLCGGESEPKSQQQTRSGANWRGGEYVAAIALHDVLTLDDALE